MPKPTDFKKGSWDRKKNAIMREYRKIQKCRNPNKPFTSLNHQPDAHQKKMTFFKRAMHEYEQKNAEKQKEKEVRVAEKRKKQEEFRKYIQKKKENFKKITKKTKWGQPVMEGRMEVLLEKIQKSVSSSSEKITTHTETRTYKHKRK